MLAGPQHTLTACAAFLLLAATPSNPRPVTESSGVMAIFLNDLGLQSRGQPSLVFAAWADGYVVQSRDQARGGPPYVAGTVPRARVAATLAMVEKEGGFADEALRRACYGPDSAYMTILVRSGNKSLRMDSWHELFETDPRLVVRSCSVMSLDGKSRAEVLQAEPREFRHYRAVWSRIRQLAATLSPERVEPIEGALAMAKGEVSWRGVSSR